MKEGRRQDKTFPLESMSGFEQAEVVVLRVLVFVRKGEGRKTVRVGEEAV